MSLYPTAERRIRILETLIERRYETTGVLAAEFQVCRSTIKRDFQMLCIYHPLYSRSGSNGGLFVMEGYSLGRKYLSDEQATFLESIMTPIRKLAHFTLYFILGFIASGLFVTIKNRGMLLKSAVSWGVCVLYAVSDEIHQYFVPGRACAAFDVFIDSLGAGLAVALFAVAICVISPLKKYKKFQ